MQKIPRREFVKDTASISAGASLGLGALKKSTAAWAGANDRIRVAVIGLNNRGARYHCNRFPSPRPFELNKSNPPEEKHENVEVAVICDVDTNLFESTAKVLFDERGHKRPRFEQDFRKVLEDDSIDVVSVATTNHWHTPMSIMACQAGKDVYVEKPISHNVWEGRQVVKAAKKYNRIVQHGTQIRSSPGSQEAMRLLREGFIGDVYMAKGLCYKGRPSIGKTPEEAPLPGVDYDLWLGPAPKRPYTKNRFHYNWHFFWDYGNGDIGNQGVHQMDVARWGLGVGLPPLVHSTGGKFSYDDDQETANTQIATFRYPNYGKHGAVIVFEVRHMHTYPELGVGVGNIFFGSEGYMTLDSYIGYKAFRNDGEKRERYEDRSHIDNFLAAVRSRKAEDLTAPPEEGHLSSAMCHLANISYRLNRSLEFDPETERCIGDEEAEAMLKGHYREPFVVSEIV
jgi:predicted dehydrogenase